MVENQFYSKPCMNNMPRDVGTQIIKEILNSSPVNNEKISRDLAKFEKKVLEERRKNVVGY